MRKYTEFFSFSDFKRKTRCASASPLASPLSLPLLRQRDGLRFFAVEIGVDRALGCG